MKRLLLILVMSFFTLVLIGCDGMTSGDISSLLNETTIEITTTEGQTTVAPTTEQPTTIEEPTTEQPTTEEQPTTIEEPTTNQATEEPTTVVPTTNQATEEPTTVVPTTNQPTTIAPTTGASTTEDPSVTTQLDVVSGLSINETTQVLSWTPVVNAIAYEIYINGEFQIEVTGSSYDFSALEMDSMIFSIIAVAPQGMRNSSMSTTLAYVTNKTDAVSAMLLSLSASPIYLNNPEAFATELVDKGMLASDYDDMMTSMANLENLDTISDMNDMYSLIDQVFESMDRMMIEAFISALIKVELPLMLQDEIDHLIAYDGTCEVYDYYYEECYEYYDNSDDIIMLENILMFIESHSDETVGTVMVLINYLLDVQASIDQDMITELETIIGLSPFQDFTMALMIALKNNFVNELKANLPSIEDMVLLNSTLFSFMDVMTEGEMDLSLVSMNQMAQQELLMMNLAFNFILEIDQAYLRSFMNIIDQETPEMVKEFIKENIILLDRFIDNNALLMEELDNVYSDEELEEIFFEMLLNPLMIQMYYSYSYDVIEDPLIEEEIKLLVRENIDFSQILLLGDSISDSMNQLLDAIIASDFRIVDLVFDAIMLGSNQPGDYLVYNDDDMNQNFALGITLEPGEYQLVITGFSESDYGDFDLFVTYNLDIITEISLYLSPGQVIYRDIVITETTLVEAYTTGSVDTVGYIIYKEEEVMNPTDVMLPIIHELLSLMNPIFQDMTIEEYTALVGLITSAVNLQLDVMTLNDESMIEIQTALAYAFAGIDNTLLNQYHMIQNIMEVLDTTPFIDEYAFLYNTRYENELTYYGQGIAFANFFIELYSVNVTDINALKDEFFFTISQPEMMTLLQLTATDIDQMESDMDFIIDEFFDLAYLIKDYDYLLLTETEMIKVEDFIIKLSEFGIYIEFPVKEKEYEPGVEQGYIEIVVPYELTYFYQRMIDEYIEAYNLSDDNPYRYPHHIEVIGEDISAMYMEDMFTDYGADIVALPEPSLGKFINDLDVLAPIQSPELIAFMMEHIDSEIVEALVFNDQYYGAPYSMESLFLYYNKSYLSETDVLTWEGIWKIAKENEIYSTAITSIDNYNNNFLLLSSFDNTEIRPVTLFEGGLNTNTDFVNDGAISVMKWGQRFFSDPNGVITPEYYSWQYEFAYENVLSFIGGAWHYNEAYDILGENLGIAVLPRFTLTAEDVYGTITEGTVMQSGAFTDGKVFVKNKLSYELDYLDDIIAYLVSIEVQEEAVYYGVTPSIQSAKTDFESLAYNDTYNEMMTVQLEMVHQGLPQPFKAVQRNMELYYMSDTAWMIYDMLKDNIYYDTDEAIITLMQEVEDIWMLDGSTGGEDEFYYYITGNFAGWADAFGDINYLMMDTSLDSPVLSELYDQLQYASEIYTVEVILPTETAGWYHEYTIDGVPTMFDGNLTVKFAYTNYIDGFTIPMFWAPSPESGQIMNLTPDTLFLPEYVAEAINGGGNWNDNPVVFVPGHYTMVVAMIDGQLWFGAIHNEEFGFTYELLDDNTYSVTGYQGPYTDITIPDSYLGSPVTSISNYAFQFSTITSIGIPSSIVNIAINAFYQTQDLTSITVSEENEHYLSENGILFNNEKSKLVWYPASRVGTDYLIPDGVEVIGFRAFHNSVNLVNVTIPDSVIEIQSAAFNGAQKLSSVTLSEYVVSLGDCVFQNAIQLKSIHVDENNNIYSSQDGVLFDKDMTVLIEYPAGKLDLTYRIPDGVVYVASYSFSSAANLTSLTIPNGVLEIGYGAFQSCVSLSNVIFEPGSQLKEISDSAFIYSGLIDVVLPEGIITIGPSAFGSNFYLRSIYIPSTVTTIGHGAFWGNNQLEEITFEEGSQLTTIEGYAFRYNESLLRIDIPDSVIYMAENAFIDCFNTVIYTSQLSRPSGWDVNWNPDNLIVAWGNVLP